MRRVGIRITRRMRKKAVQQGRSEVRDAKNNERHVCGRRRDGELAVSRRRIVTIRTRPSRACRDRLFAQGRTVSL